MLRLICLILLSLTCFTTSAQDKTVRKDLGLISNTQIVSGKEMKSLVDQNPDGQVFILTFKERLGTVVDRSTVVYVPGEKKLGLYTMSTMTFWRVWSNIEPEAFKDGLPYGQKSISDTTNPGPFPLRRYVN